MKNTTERRQLILERILENRYMTMKQLMEEFQICKKTACRDVMILSCSYPIYTMTGGSGGIYVADSFRLGMKYFTEEQVALLEKLSEGLTNEELEIMNSILKTFKRPVLVK